MTGVFQLAHLQSPMGGLLLIAKDEKLAALDFEHCEARLRALFHKRFPKARLETGRVPPAIAKALRAYFAGDLAALSDIALEEGGTPFQRRVWKALRMIKPGETLSYGALAARIGKPGAARAVGLANGSNPIGIVTPCHRVIGANGRLTGYAGGLEAKAFLLKHEKAEFRP